MQNNHIASVTLYGAPRTTSQARPESSSSSHWTSNQNNIPFWFVLNLVPLLTEPLTRSQILNQADVTQKNKAILAQLRCDRTETTWTQNNQNNLSSWVSLFQSDTPSQHSQPNPDYPRNQDLVTWWWCWSLDALKWNPWNHFLVVWESPGGTAAICALVELNGFLVPSSGHRRRVCPHCS